MRAGSKPPRPPSRVALLGAAMALGLLGCGDDAEGAASTEGSDDATSSTTSGTSTVSGPVAVSSASSGSAGGPGTGGDGGGGGAGAGGDGGGLPLVPCEAGDWITTPLPVGQEDGVDLMAASVPTDDGGLLVIYEHFDEAFTTAALLAAHVCPNGAVEQLGALALGDEAMVSSPSFVDHGGETFLYFTATSSLAAPLAVHRARLDRGFGPREEVGPIDGVVRLQSFPRFTTLGAGDGGVGVAFHDGAGRPSYARSADGRTFAAPTRLASAPKALAHVAPFAGGQLAFTYQTGQNPQIQTFQIAPDGAGESWTEPEPVTSASSNVHDASALLREDGDLDLYYIYPVEAFGFSVLRRSLSPAGELGVEERVTFASAGDATKPSPVRLPTGEVALVYAEITERSGGVPTKQRLGLLVLPGDG